LNGPYKTKKNENWVSGTDTNPPIKKGLFWKENAHEIQIRNTNIKGLDHLIEEEKQNFCDELKEGNYFNVSVQSDTVASWGWGEPGKC
jgi:hypothetical protein